MKFGKRFKAAHVAGWAYLDYKMLKKQLRTARGLGLTEQSVFAAGFSQEVLNEVEFVNTFYLDKERALLQRLPRARPAGRSDVDELAGGCSIA